MEKLKFNLLKIHLFCYNQLVSNIFHMKSIFQKSKFTQAPGGNLYEWKDAKTSFTIPESGLFVIKIVAAAKNAKQNNSTDDDDLRTALDGFSFGKYEKHDEKISWKGFGTSASWDGASLKGGTKTIYFFVELEKGDHTVQFFADETPEIKSLEIFHIEDNEFILNNLKPPEQIENNRNGIPWLSFVFVGTHAKSVLLDVDTKSAKEKNNTDGDNLKVIVNGDILQNERVPTSKKYGNFYFSGDIKSTGILSISNDDLSAPLAFENSIELWYDQMPTINSLQIIFFDTEKFLKELEEVNLIKYVLNRVKLAILSFRIAGSTYSAKFLEHSLEEHPAPLVFKANHPIVRKIKADPVYKEILKKLKERITVNILEGEIWPEDMGGKINFDSPDLKYAIHGIKKIEYKVEANHSGKFEVKMTLFDIYDFEKQDVPFFLLHGYEYVKNTIINAADMGESLHIIHNFEIEFRINNTLKI